MPNFYNLLRARKFTTTADTAIEIAPSTSATPNFTIDAGGKLNWSSGSAVADTNLYRSAAGVIKTDGSVNIAAGQTYKVDGADVLTATALGTGVVSSSLTSVGSLTGLTISGTTSIQQSLEKTNPIGNITGTVAINLLTAGVHSGTGTGAFTFNFTGTSPGTTLNSIMSNNQSITSVVMVTNTTAYTLAAIQVDGTTSGVTTRWFGGSGIPAGNANSTDIYTVSIIKTGSATFTVYASQSKFA